MVFESFYLKKKLVWLWILGAILMACTAACAEPKKSDQMSEHEIELWMLVDGISNHLPMNKKMVELLTGMELTEKLQNKYFIFLEGVPNPIAFSSGQGIFSRTEFSYRLSNPTDSSLGVILDENLPCIGLESVRNRYGGGELVAPPSPPPLTPGQPLLTDFVYMTGYSVGSSWGRVNFRFHSKHFREIGCLAKISFGFNAM